jgi:hypothetical protein
MNMFVKPTKIAPPAFVGADAIKNGELTFAREDVARLKSHKGEAERELAIVNAKLVKVRAIEQDLLSDESALLNKISAVSRMMKVKERALFDLEQDGGSI